MNRRAVVLVPVLLAVSTALASMRPAFDQKEVVRHMPHRQANARPPIPDSGSVALGLDDGEFLVDTTFVYNRSPGYYASVVSDGLNFLVLWSDQSSEIRAMRVSQSCQILDTGGFVVAQPTGRCQYPRAAFDGTNYFVVWMVGEDTISAIRGARVSTGGVLIDSTPFLISRIGNLGGPPAIAFDGDKFLVVWSDGSDREGNISAARVMRSGVVLDTAGIVVCADTGLQWYPSVAGEAGEFLVVWQDSFANAGRVYGRRVTDDGAIPDTASFAISERGRGCEPEVIAADSNYFVVWGRFDISAARVTHQGILIDSASILVEHSSYSSYHPSAIYDGDCYHVFWGDTRNGSTNDDIYSARVSSGGVVVDTEGKPVTRAQGNQYDPAVALAGGTRLVVWQDWRDNATYEYVYGTRVNAAGVPLDTGDVALSLAASIQLNPAAACDGRDFLVVWEDHRRCDTSDIYGAFVRPSGPTGLDFPISAAPSDQTEPAIACGDSCYLVVWQDFRTGGWDIRGTRVTADGVVLDTQGIVISAAGGDQANPAVASDGTNFLVVWHDGRTDPYSHIYGARVSAQGTVLDPNGIAICTAFSNQSDAAVVLADSCYLVAWEDERNRQYEFDIYGARVSTAGTILDPGGFRIFGGTGTRWYPALATNGTDVLAAWMDGGGEYDVLATRLSHARIPLDTSGIFVWAGGDPTLTFDGVNWVVLWITNPGNECDILGARLDQTGRIVDLFDAAALPGDQQSPTILCGPQRQLLVLYSGWTERVGARVCRAMRIWGKLGPFGAVNDDNNCKDLPATPCATVLGGVLSLSREWSVGGRQPVLLDISGRKVMELHPGPNDVSRFGAGVYFVRSAVSDVPSAVRKIIVTR